MSKTGLTRAHAEMAAAMIKGYFGGFGEMGDDQFFIADHEHEGLTEGAWSIACEGHLPVEWTVQFSWEESVRKALAAFGMWAEPINGCILAIYPVE